MEFVTLVDTNDRPIGTAEKLEAHRKALLHRACSVVLFNGDGEMLLQQRHAAKYHSGGLWSNTCCTHPRPGETAIDAARRRLREEIGIEAELEHLFSFVYRAELDDGLVEHEYDHVYVGEADESPSPDADEVQDWRWASTAQVARDLEARPERYTRWFLPLFARLREITGHDPEVPR
jgi:isopentenyl-diphosphate delta-isomerase